MDRRQGSQGGRLLHGPVYCGGLRGWGRRGRRHAGLGRRPARHCRPRRHGHQRRDGLVERLLPADGGLGGGPVPRWIDGRGSSSPSTRPRFPRGPRSCPRSFSVYHEAVSENPYVMHGNIIVDDLNDGILARPRGLIDLAPIQAEVGTLSASASYRVEDARRHDAGAGRRGRGSQPAVPHPLERGCSSSPTAWTTTRSSGDAEASWSVTSHPPVLQVHYTN